MSLFKQLEKLYRPDQIPLEDVHTEIVAQVLKNSPELTLAWLRDIEVTTPKEAHIDINPQKKFTRLPEHETGSRPDITIRIVAGREEELIFVESKLGSTQGYDQLLRYADHLAELKRSQSLARVSLVYITRDFEAVEDPRRPGVTFKTTRWFEFYQHLKAHVKKNSDGLAKELKLFMEENRMSLGNQFRSTDLVAMENFLSAKALMNETLGGEVSERAAKIFGSVSNLKGEVYKQLRELNRYIIFSYGFDCFECLIGYFLPHENPDEPVWVGIKLYVGPNSAMRKEVIQAFRGWVEKQDSWLDEPDEGIGWSGIRKCKSIQALLA